MLGAMYNVTEGGGSISVLGRQMLQVTAATGGLGQEFPQKLGSPVHSPEHDKPD